MGILMFHLRRPSSLIVGIVFSLICTIVLAWWPIEPLWNRVYSPYQLLEIGTDSNTGLTLIRASGHYYQRINDFSGHNPSPILSKGRDYYDFPYKAHPALTDVAVVGSGTGNDVAAALRAGAERVDAIEIDPAILLVGQQNHPEKPYENPRVHAHNNDARSFLRETANKYDLIVYGLLDSHTLLTQGSSVRLDSFVYTLEGLREARNRLKPGGMISFSFAVLSESLGRKIYLMLQEVFDGRSPVCVYVGYEGATFLISNDPNWALPARLTSADITDLTAAYANPSVQASVSTEEAVAKSEIARLTPIIQAANFPMIALSMVMLDVFAECAPQGGRWRHAGVKTVPSLIPVLLKPWRKALVSSNGSRGPWSTHCAKPAASTPEPGSRLR
jgi:spermidine synthase